MLKKKIPFKYRIKVFRIFSRKRRTTLGIITRKTRWSLSLSQGRIRYTNRLLRGSNQRWGPPKQCFRRVHTKIKYLFLKKTHTHTHKTKVNEIRTLYEVSMTTLVVVMITYAKYSCCSSSYYFCIVLLFIIFFLWRGQNKKLAPTKYSNVQFCFVQKQNQKKLGLGNAESRGRAKTLMIKVASSTTTMLFPVHSDDDVVHRVPVSCLSIATQQKTGYL